MKGLYIHIPFCRSKCFYCSFSSWAGQERLIDNYLKALFLEMEKYRGEWIYSVFIGGGTPTFLSSSQLRSMLEKIFSVFVLEDESEISIEANPGTVDQEKLSLLKNLGINRLSFGAQSTDNNLLRYLGRTHTYEDFIENYFLARKTGFANINFDLIYGISGQSVSCWQDTLDQVIKLSPEHLSLYPLTVEEDSVFFTRGEKTDEDLSAAMFEEAIDRLETAGYRHYEISNFAREGFSCRHNQLYWRNQEYLGLGASACSYLAGRRAKNAPEIEDYCARIFSGRSTVVEEDILSAEKTKGETIILGLRLKEGVFFSPEEELQYQPALTRCCEQSLLTKTGQRWQLTRRGILLANCVFREFI
ncbi:MAG: radical SAM family heme chaperone HemW [Elusimicrobiota bacterium]